MKKWILLIGAVGAGIYFGIRGLYKFCWRAGVLACLVSPVAMGFWLAYAINVMNWKVQTLFTLPPLIVLSVVVGIREFTWTEPLLTEHRHHK